MTATRKPKPKRMGRPPKPAGEKYVTRSFSMPGEVSALIDEHAAEHEVSDSAALVQLVRAGVGRSWLTPRGRRDRRGRMDAIDARPERELNRELEDPGIRQTARWLQQHGFSVTSASAGTTGPGEPTPPNVYCAVSPDDLLGEVRRMVALVASAELLPSADALVVGSVNGTAGTASIMLIGVADGMLPWGCP